MDESKIPMIQSAVFNSNLMARSFPKNIVDTDRFGLMTESNILSSGGLRVYPTRLKSVLETNCVPRNQKTSIFAEEFNPMDFIEAVEEENANNL